MNLHIMYDEKVISRTIKYFEEALPGSNKYIVMTDHNNGKRLVNAQLSNILYTNYGSNEFWDFVGDTRQYKYVILHFLGDELRDFTSSTSQTDNFVWIVWGGDLYHGLLEPYGFKMYAHTDFIKKGKLGKYFPFIDRYLIRRSIRDRVETVRKIPTICIGSGDYKTLRKYIPKFRPQRKDFFYYPVDDMVDESLRNQRVSSNNIFVGNSASLTNNHRMVFEILSKYDLGDRKVITPLSYGDNLGKEIALEWGEKLIKKNFYPVLDFMPLEEYNKLMLSANLFIYGNYRQEAFGNILVALYLGGIVVLSHRNPIVQDLTEKGFVFFFLKDFKKLLDYQLPEEIRRKNRELVQKWYNRERLLNVIKESFG